MTSAVTTTVIGEAKIIGLMALSALLLGAQLPLHRHQLSCRIPCCLDSIWSPASFCDCDVAAVISDGTLWRRRGQGVVSQDGRWRGEQWHHAC